MSILVLNGGSSSLKFRLYAEHAGSQRLVAGGVVGAFGAHAECALEIDGRSEHIRAAIHNHGEAALWVRRRLRQSPAAPFDAIGHRVVHGGEALVAPAFINDDILARLQALIPLAPVHNPIALEIIHACRAELGASFPMVAVFDTAFHAELPEHARTYALPARWRARGIRRYGFHGIAHRFMYERLCAVRPRGTTSRVVTFQLGNGCSVTAIRDGRSVDTSMGYTPLEGLIMSTRSGDVDPGALVELVSSGVSAAELSRGLNHEAGLLGLSGATSDMRELLALEADGHAGARLAIEAFCRRARKYLGAYLGVLNGADAIVFGGGIGEHAPSIRARICGGMEWCGLRLDDAANAGAVGAEQLISPAGSSVAAYVIPVNEELLIARDTAQLLARQRLS